jgi:hypothetical protein
MNNDGLDDGGGKAPPAQSPVQKIARYNNICTASSMTGAVAQNDWSWSNNSQSSTNGTGLCLDDVSRSLFGGRGVGMYNHNIIGGLLLAKAASTSVSVSTPTQTLPDSLCYD